MVNLRILKRFLRSPKVILAEIAMITLVCILGSAIPQADSTADVEFVANPFVKIFAFDHIFKSFWFLAITLLCFASLLVVISDQIKRLRFAWSKELSEEDFRNSTYCTEFERPARLEAGQFTDGPQVEIKTKDKLALAGSLVFHAGILLLIIAGILRALFAVDAVVDLMEGETLPTTVQAWGAQWPGIMAKPLKLDHPVILDKVKVDRYKSGALKDLSVVLSIERSNDIEKHEVAINKELKISGLRLFLGNKYGPTALIEWHKEGNSLAKDAVLLADKGNQTYEASISGPDGLQGYFRTHKNSNSIEMRVMKDNALLHVGKINVGQTIQLPEGQTLLLHGMPLWARLNASSDPALWLAYLGFALGLIGSVIIFFLTKNDTCVIVTPAGDIERVFVALRVQRFAPLFEHRFRQLVQEQGGTA